MTHLNLAGPALIPTPAMPLLDLHTAVRLTLTGFSFHKIH